MQPATVYLRGNSWPIPLEVVDLTMATSGAGFWVWVPDHDGGQDVADHRGVKLFYPMAKIDRVVYGNAHPVPIHPTTGVVDPKQGPPWSHFDCPPCADYVAPEVLGEPEGWPEIDDGTIGNSPEFDC